VRRSKSKCGATVRWLVGGVAPLLILLKRWLVCSFFVSQFDCCTVANRMTANGPGVCEVAMKVTKRTRRYKYKANLVCGGRVAIAPTPC